MSRRPRRKGQQVNDSAVIHFAGRVLELVGFGLAVWRWNHLATLVFATACVVSGHGLRRLRSVHRSQALLALRIASIGLGAALVLALGSGRLGDERVARDIHQSLPLVSAIVVLVALVIATTPAREVHEVSRNERLAVDTIAQGLAADLCAPFSRRHDKRYVWSPDGEAFVGYRTVFGVCVAGPGPVGRPESRSAALEAWLSRCAGMGWRPMMIGADDDVRRLALHHPGTQRRRMWSLHFGDEVIVETRSIELATPQMRNVRQAVQRTKNRGVTVSVVREGALGHAQRDELLAVVEEWEAGRGTYGYSMTMDHLLDGVYHDAILVVAEWKGQVVGFQRWFEARNGTGLTLDVMPRRRECPNGVNERLIIETADWAIEHGVDELSLNFAAFRWVFEASPSVGRAAVATVVHVLDRFLDVESLYRFNAKFQPTWHPRHVLFESLYDVPLVIAAAIRLEFGRRPERAKAAHTTHTATTTP